MAIIRKTPDSNEEQRLCEKEVKEYVCFVEVPKRFQTVDNASNKLKNESETSENL